MRYILFRRRNFYLMLLADAVLVAAAFVLAFCLRFDGPIPPLYRSLLLRYLPYLVPAKLLIFFIFGLYRGMWRYTGLRDLRAVFAATGLSSLLLLTISYLIRSPRPDPLMPYMPRSIPILDFGLSLMFVGGIRVAVRLVLSRGDSLTGLFRMAGQKKVMVLGAGDEGERMIREMHANPGLKMTPVGLLDDNPASWGKALHGCRVLGGIDHLADVTVEFDEILIALPTITRDRMRDIVRLCEATGKPFRIIPNLAEMMDGRLSVKTIREVRFEDLLGREEIRLERDLLLERYADKRILVTGAGGSIGSELVRQLGHFRPRSLALLDFSEFNLFQVSLKTRQLFPELDCRTYLVDVRDPEGLKPMMSDFRPQVILHAAAYKHVPLQESNPREAVLNNVAGTRNMIRAALDFQAERFVLVSTDKAVRPTSVMGASKRLAEMLVESANDLSGCSFAAVRFGNVLGSSGSVVPIFESQIASRLPVTVTHPEVTRFFMSIPEAAQLILQAGAMAEGGEIFILDMGQPVRIAELARDLIRLHGLEPDRDVTIQFIGLRPGEKLYEELITVGEGIVGTRHKKIRVIRNNRSSHSSDHRISDDIAPLLAAAQSGDGDGIRRELKRLIPEYRPADGKRS